MANIFTGAARGNGEALNRLCDSCAGMIYTVCRLLSSGDQQAARTTVQVFEAVLKAVKNGEIKSEEALKSKVLSLCASVCKETAEKSDSKAFVFTGEEAAEAAEPEAQVFSGDPSRGTGWLSKAMASLPAAEKFTAALRLCGMDFSQIGQVLGQSEGAAKALWNKALPAIEGNLRNLTEKTYSIDIPKPGQLSQMTADAMNKSTLPKAGEKLLRKIVEDNTRAPSKWQKPLYAALLAVAVIAAVILIRKPFGQDSVPAEPAATGEGIYADIMIKDYGLITVKLEPDSAPITVDNFVTLAESGFYDGLTFHRIMKGFMMQGGDPEGTGFGGSDKMITGEFAVNGVENYLSHTRGAISMARSNDFNSARSQFFIVHEDSTFLDGNYACFGYVVSGIEVVDAVCNDAKPTDDNGSIAWNDQPVIEYIKITGN